MAFNKYYKQEVEWNINQVFSEILKEIIIEINHASLSGDVRAKFNACRILYNNIHGHEKIKDDTMKAIDKNMKLANARLKKLPDNYLMIQLNETQKRYLDSIKRILDDTHRDLLDAMYQAGLMFPISRKDPRHAGLETH